jgi:hypothetical protein
MVLNRICAGALIAVTAATASIAAAAPAMASTARHGSAAHVAHVSMGATSDTTASNGLNPSPASGPCRLLPFPPVAHRSCRR